MTTQLTFQRIGRTLLALAFVLSPVPASAQESQDWVKVAQTNEALASQRPHDGQAWLRWGEALLELDAAGEAVEVLRRAEHEFEAKPMLKGAPRFGLARAHAALGQREEALAALEKAARSGFSDLAALERAPELARLAGDPRFEKVHEALRALARPHLVPEILVELSVPVAPSPFRANGKNVLAYELHVFSSWPRELTIVGLEVLEDAEPARRVAYFEGAKLQTLLEQPGETSARPRTKLVGNSRVVAFPWIELDPAAPVPARLKHRLWLQGLNFWNASFQPIVEGGSVATAPAALVIGAPLRGESWVARATGNASYHHRGLQVVLGRMMHPQSFGVDWARWEDIVWNSGEKTPSSNQDLVTFGQEVLAVSDGVVASARDGLPDNAIGDTPFVVPYGEAFGNHVVLDLGQGRYASYAHLMQGSLRVKSGDAVRRGQVLARIGASGDSFGPHLHFHLSTSPSPYLGDGLPYVLESFVVLGWEDPKLGQKGELPELSLATTDVRKGEMPVDNVVVRFL